MKKLLSLLAITVACLLGHQSYAQNNLEGQIIASDYGQFQVPGTATGSLHFSPASCQVSAGSKNFAAFTVGVPLKIVDSNPALNEIDTPVGVFINDCSISMSTSHIHATPFYVTSGTGGLQEALINGPSKAGGANTVIINADWYSQVLPGTPASVIAAVKGSTALGLVDVTTSPYTYYTWNTGSSQYVAVSGGGGANFPGTPGIVFNTTTAVARNATSGDVNTLLGTSNINANAANLWGTPALPNGTTVTTQPNGTNNGTAASTAYVIANTGGATFPGTNGVVFNTGVGTSRNATASDLNAVFGYTPISAAYWGALTGCATAGFVYSPQSNTCISVGGNPGGSNTQVQYNNAGAFAGDSTFTFDNSAKTLGFQNGTIAPLGTATSSTNFGSGIFSICGSYWTGSAPANGCATIQSNMGTGVNPYMSTNFVFSNPGGGQFNFPYSVFLDGFGIDAANSSGVVGFASPANMPLGGYGITPPPTPPTVTSVWSCNPSSSPLTVASICSWVPGGSGGGGAVTPTQFGGFGDAYAPPNGCITTAGSGVINCAGPFVPGDVGKDVWVHGAGASGAALHGTIITFTDSSHVTINTNATASLTNTNGNMVFGHDDVVAVQACWQYSATNNVPCAMVPLPTPSGGGFTGFLIGSAGLKIVPGPNSQGMNVSGGAAINGTTLFCEFNGDCVSLQAGPIQAATVSNIGLLGDPTQPNGRGFHFNAAAGVFGVGGLWYSTFTNTWTQNFNLECMLSEGGNYLSGGLLPNQVDTFINFNCQAPSQMHTANIIKMTGQHAQITFINGQTNGPGSEANQPNAMILITEQNSGHADSATDVKFFGYTYEVGTIGLQLGNGAYNIHYDNSYVEAVASPLIAGGANGVYGLTYNGNHIANSGDGTAVAQFTGNVTGSFRDSLVYGGSPAAAALAVCTGTGNTVDFVGNTGLVTTTTTGCATSTAAPSSNTLVVTGGTSVSVAADSTPIVTLQATGVNSGKTETLYASGTFSLASGGNINLGGNVSPLVIPAGHSATLTLLDTGPGWLVTSVSSPFIAPGTAPTITGCGTISAQHGNATAGDFTTSTTGTCTAVIPLPAATNGWHCDVTDITQHAVANLMLQNATSTTSCTVTGTTAASDVLSFVAVAY